MNEIYAVTGGATGIGGAVSAQLRSRGARVIVVDLKDAEICADLGTEAGRQHTIAQLEKLAPDGLDGLIPCAGLGPSVKPSELIARVNFFGSVRLVIGLKSLLQKRQGRIVLVSSNSASLPGYRPEYIKALLALNEDEACRVVTPLDGQSAYGGSKYALAVWMRKNAPEYMRCQVRMNAVAPGITRTAMTDGVFQDPQWGKAIRQFSEMTPAGEMATPDMIADAILFLLGPASRFVCGSVLFVDGGTDALLRPEGF